MIFWNGTETAQTDVPLGSTHLIILISLAIVLSALAFAYRRRARLKLSNFTYCTSCRRGRRIFHLVMVMGRSRNSNAINDGIEVKLRH